MTLVRMARYVDKSLVQNFNMPGNVFHVTFDSKILREKGRTIIHRYRLNGEIL
jgi:hypothetical protein